MPGAGTSIHKVTKAIHKKKGPKFTGALHENSRDSKRLRRASARDDKLARHSKLRERLNDGYLQRISHFCAIARALPPTTDSPQPLPLEQIQTEIQLFLARHTAELSSLASTRRPGRPPTPREIALKHEMEAEEREYESGFWVPDMQDAESLERLRGWTGEWAGLGPVGFVRVDRRGVVKGSSFPPKGSS